MADSDVDSENDAPNPEEHKEEVDTELGDIPEILGDTYSDVTSQSADHRFSETVSTESSKPSILKRTKVKKQPGAKTKIKKAKKPQKQGTTDQKSDLKSKLPSFNGWDIGGTIQPAPLNRAMDEKELMPVLLQRAQRRGWGRRGRPDVDLLASSVCPPMLQRKSQPPPPAPPLPPIVSAEEPERCGERKGVNQLYRLLGNERPQILQEEVRHASDNPTSFPLDKSGHQTLMEMTTILVDQRPDDPLQVLQDRLHHETTLGVRKREALETIRNVAQRKWNEKVKKEMADPDLLPADEDLSSRPEVSVDEEVETTEAGSDIYDIDEYIMWGHDTDCDPMF